MGSPLRVNSDVLVNGQVDVVGETSPEFWATGAWDALDRVTITSGDVTVSATTPAVGGSFGVQRGRLTHTGGVFNSQRFVYLYPEFRHNQRMRGCWQDHSVKSTGGTAIQTGYALRVRRDPDGWWRGYFVRHDIIFGLDAVVQCGLLRWNDAGDFLEVDANTAGTFPGMTGIGSILNVVGASRTGNVVTLVGITDSVTGFPVPLVTGHTYTVSFADASYNTGGPFVATGPATWAQVAADDPAAGAGVINDLDGIWPLNVDTGMDGPNLYTKVWRAAGNRPEPSWSDPGNNLVMRAAAADPYPDAVGRKGFFLGHATAGKFTEFGPVDLSRM
jgi:hypothetical protein